VDPDPGFRLKVVVVIAAVLGVFCVAFVAQRVWYWIKTRKRDDVETSHVVPFIDLSLLVIGAAVIWLAAEGLFVALRVSAFAQVPARREKIAEIEVGRADAVNGQLTLLFYPVDAAGQRRRGYNVPVFTRGKSFELNLEVFKWRGLWSWLGETGFFQYVSLSGANGEGKDLASRAKPGGVGGAMLLSPSVNWTAKPGQDVKEGDVFDVYLSDDSAEVVLR
jgi:hypothetical protein